MMLSARPNNQLVTAFVITSLLLFLAWNVTSTSRTYPNFKYAKTTGNSVINNTLPDALDGVTNSKFVDPIDNVFNSTLGQFEKIFVVNLPLRTDRRDGMILAAAVSNIDIEFIDGIVGENVPDKALPPGGGRKNMPEPDIGSWRGHMNVLQTIVSKNLSSALILEDDADWDIHIRSQLHDLALSTRALIQPLQDDPSSFADPTYPFHDPGSLDGANLDFENLPRTILPANSPYGDDWDILWLGYSGMQAWPVQPQTPHGRVIQRNDPTVAEHRYLKNSYRPHPLSSWPEHTRVVSHVSDPVCIFAYAISQAGARRLLHQFGLLELETPFDVSARTFCEGTDSRKAHICLTTQPTLFESHRPRGLTNKESDISPQEHGDGFKEEASTDSIRWSTRLNMDVFLAPDRDGEKAWIDSFPDTEG